MQKYICTAAAIMLAATISHAEEANYGSIYLSGLARNNTWELNSFPMHNAMVCNVNGPDGFLSVRSGPGSDFDQVRAFNRLAILEVDTSQRRGNWVRIVGGSRTHTALGHPQNYKALPVTGWAHDGYLCDFMD